MDWLNRDCENVLTLVFIQFFAIFCYDCLLKAMKSQEPALAVGPTSRENIPNTPLQNLANEWKKTPVYLINTATVAKGLKENGQFFRPIFRPYSVRIPSGLIQRMEYSARRFPLSVCRVKQSGCSWQE